MPFDDLLAGPADPARIDVHAAAEMRHWVRELGRSEIQLKQAVKLVGPLVSDVRVPRVNQGENPATIRMRMRRCWGDEGRA